MKKVKKRSTFEDLMVDVVEYAFIEWLVRRGSFYAFKANFVACHLSRRSFRDCLRDHIRRSLRSSVHYPHQLISISFPFRFAPEGVDFWLKESCAWSNFYSKFVTES